MKKAILSIVLLSFALTACTGLVKSDNDKLTVHENIREELAIDTIEVLDVLEESIVNKEPLDEDIIEQYEERYIDLVESDEDAAFTGEESALFTFTNLLAVQAEDFKEIENREENFGMLKESLLYFIEHGEENEELFDN